MFKNLNGKKIIIGCVHLLPMPNTPFFKNGDYEASLEKALKDATALKEGGADGCLIQTVDRVYSNSDDTDYVRATCLSVIGHEVKKLVGPDFKVGVQIMWNCITPSLASCIASHADFTRCSVLVGQSDSAYGPLVGDPHKVMNYRHNVGADHVEMIAEIAGYHFLNKGEYDKKTMLHNAGMALTVGADAIEAFHKEEELNNRMVRDLKEAYPGVTVVLGGGTNVENAASRLKYADCAIVGSCFENGNWGGPVHKDIVKSYVDNVRAIEV